MHVEMTQRKINTQRSTRHKDVSNTQKMYQRHINISKIETSRLDDTRSINHTKKNPLYKEEAI
jgi:hypothetical protein